MYLCTQHGIQRDSSDCLCAVLTQSGIQHGHALLLASTYQRSHYRTLERDQKLNNLCTEV